MYFYCTTAIIATSQCSIMVVEYLTAVCRIL